ncbi:MAG: hypothetical protein JXA04_01365 [Gammaproteobacteria bacterium]|nr:hypothetical protein [Gammaproteobacteria bacterium]
MYVLSARDHDRLQAIIRAFEAGQLNRPRELRRFRRISNNSPHQVLYGTVINDLSYTGDDSYHLLPEDDNTPVWSPGGGSEPGGDYPVDFWVKGNDGILYKCAVSAGSGTTNPTDEEETIWVYALEINHVLGYSTSVVDMRSFAPWLKKNSLVPYVLHEETYYVLLGFSFVGAPGNRSIMWDEDDWRLMGVWK